MAMRSVRVGNSMVVVSERLSSPVQFSGGLGKLVLCFLVIRVAPGGRRASNAETVSTWVAGKALERVPGMIPTM